jgi:translocator protein
MNRDLIRQVVNVVATIAVIVVNALASALPLNGLDTGEISDRFSVYFVPAGYVFSIWGVIYLGLIAFSVYQALPSQRENRYLRRIGYWYALSCAANVAWIFLWHYLVFPLTLVAMLVLLAALIVIYLRIENGLVRRPRAETWAVRIPFSIYLGWITVATIANVTSLLDYLQWNRWGISDVAWTVVMLIAGGVIASLVGLTRRDTGYWLVIAWAFAGIAVKHSSVLAVSITSVVIAVAVVAVSVWATLQARSNATPAG